MRDQERARAVCPPGTDPLSDGRSEPRVTSCAVSPNETSSVALTGPLAHRRSVCRVAGLTPASVTLAPPVPESPVGGAGTIKAAAHRPSCQEPESEGKLIMSTLALLVLLLLVVVVVLLAAGAAYVVHRHPSWGAPFGAAFSTVTVMAALVGLILAR